MQQKIRGDEAGVSAWMSINSGCFCREWIHLWNLLRWTAGARPRGLRVEMERIVILSEAKRNPPVGGRSAPYAHRRKFGFVCHPEERSDRRIWFVFVIRKS
jgi:hypothetical protein